ncbi:unnamed protein product [Brachionus calyciflorus]|uniref:Uncharacterized protein n=1 Tax=Brachionus calyciflorus TaxID=104777 RepID=A0A814MBH0_9BILA|nr:unnamed protein product [Brachionus calyciflorus]
MMRHFIGSGVPPNFGSLINSFGSENFIPYDSFIYCSNCSFLKQLLHTKYYNCGDCNKAISRFYHLSIRYQLEEILKNKTDILDYQENSQNEIFKEISKCHSEYVTLTINSDGLSVFKSSNITVWSVYLTVQLIKKQRFKLKNVIIGEVDIEDYDELEINVIYDVNSDGEYLQAEVKYVVTKNQCKYHLENIADDEKKKKALVEKAQSI